LAVKPDSGQLGEQLSGGGEGLGSPGTRGHAAQPR
jgi:hypothetical protein